MTKMVVREREESSLGVQATQQAVPSECQTAWWVYVRDEANQKEMGVQADLLNQRQIRELCEEESEAGLLELRRQLKEEKQRRLEEVMEWE